jgi:Fe2+ transport system protein FeoA
MQMRRRRFGHAAQSEDVCLNSDGTVPLTSLPEGAKATVTHTTGGLGAVRRLSEMGLTPGCEVTLRRKCSFHGPIEIEARGAALALGYGLASKICVQPLKAP